MKNEIISYDLKCISKGNAFNPIEFTTQKLIDYNVVEEVKDIQTSRIGELVSYFRLKEGITLKINRNEISISSKSFSECGEYFEKIKVINPNARLNKIELYVDEHFVDSSYPQSVFDKFVQVDGLELDIFRYKKDDVLFLLYNCLPSQMHLKIESKINFKKQVKFEEIDFKEALKVESISEKRKKFIDSFLKN